MGEEACLNIYSGVYSCNSPDTNGTQVASVPYNDNIVIRHHPNSPFMCRTCGTEGAYACDCTDAKNNVAICTGVTDDLYCDAGLTLVESDLGGKFYCNHPSTQENAPTAGPPPPPTAAAGASSS
jgi:hypothetical protein